MNSLRPFLTLDCSCDEALRWSNQNLTRSGLRVMQTFDLNAARLSLDDFACPHHGKSGCDCQMVVLLVYGDTSGPATLILYGHNGQTWLSFVDLPSQRVDPKIQSMIEGALQVSLLG